MYWCWEFVFGNYEYGSPKSSEFYWITALSIIYSFFFTYLLANTLVALVQASYGAVSEKSDIWNTRIKIAMLCSGFDFMYYKRKLVGNSIKSSNSKNEEKYTFLIVPRSAEVKSATDVTDSINLFKQKSTSVSGEILRSYKLLKSYMYKEESLLDDKLGDINKTIMNLEVYSESIS